MKKKLHLLILLGSFLAVLSLVVFNVTRQSQISRAQGLDQFAYLPIIRKPAGPTPTPTVPPSPTPGPTSTPITPPSGMIYVDHTSVALFEQIPEQYLNAAANLDMFFMDRSVGGNIDQGLTCLSYPTDEAAPNHCKVYTHGGNPSFPVDPSEVNWNRPGGYDRSNWDFEFWPVPGCDPWYDKVDCFIDRMNVLINQYDVVSYQYSYLEVSEGSTIADQPGGFFWDNPDRSDVYDFEAYVAQHPDKIFIYWTSSLARTTGSHVSEAFNDQMRQYAVDNDKILFDVADILSHAPNGSPCYDNRDGQPYSFGQNSENYPDDGQNLLAICPQYTTEVDGGHLGSISAGKIRVAKAFWVLMAQIAGWNPN